MQGLPRGVAQEVSTSIEVLRGALEDLMLRGVRVASAEDLRSLGSLSEDLRNSGADHLANSVSATLSAVSNSASDAPERLMRCMATLRVYERVLSLKVAATELALAFLEPVGDADEDGDADADGDADEDGEDDAVLSGPRAGQAPAAHSPTANTFAPSKLDAKQVLPVLDGVVGACEELLLAGLTAVSDATRAKLELVTKEASRLRLARIAAAFKYASDELARYLDQSPVFSKRRFAFFAGRAWLLARSLAGAIRRDDQVQVAQLLLGQTPVPVKRLEAVTLGVGKRTAVGTQVAFELRLRSTGPIPGFATPPRLVWSVVFAHRDGVPAEAFLHLPQPQKFQASCLLEHKAVVFEDVALAPDGAGGARLLLGPKTTVKPAKRGYAEWGPHYAWDVHAAVRRVQHHQVTPLDLEVELNEEVLLTDYSLGAPTLREDRGQLVYPTRVGATQVDLVASSGPDGKELREALEALRASRPPTPLFGLLHYELGALVMQPLAALDDAGPKYLQISEERVDMATVLKSIRF